MNIYPPLNEARTLPFVASGPSFLLSHTHTSIVFQLPPGYGQGCTIRVNVAGRESAPGPTLFDYNAPVVVNVRPFCGGRQLTGQKNYVNGECYGTVAKRYLLKCLRELLRLV